MSKRTEGHDLNHYLLQNHDPSPTVTHELSQGEQMPELMGSTTYALASNHHKETLAYIHHFHDLSSLSFNRTAQYGMREHCGP